MQSVACGKELESLEQKEISLRLIDFLRAARHYFGIFVSDANLREGIPFGRYENVLPGTTICLDTPAPLSKPSPRSF